MSWQETLEHDRSTIAYRGVLEHYYVLAGDAYHCAGRYGFGSHIGNGVGFLAYVEYEVLGDVVCRLDKPAVCLYLIDKVLDICIKGHLGPALDGFEEPVVDHALADDHSGLGRSGICPSVVWLGASALPGNKQQANHTNSNYPQWILHNPDYTLKITR